MKLPLDKPARKAIAKAAGAGIARMRLRAGLTQEAVASSLGIGLEAVSRLERGIVDPSISRLVELAELFGCRVEELLAPGSGRPADLAMAIFNDLAGLSAKDRDSLAAIVRQLAELLRAKHRRRRSVEG